MEKICQEDILKFFKQEFGLNQLGRTSRLLVVSLPKTAQFEFSALKLFLIVRKLFEILM